MSKNAKNKLIPKLRFPEFINDGEWSKPKLNRVAEPIEERAGSNIYTTMSVTSGSGLISQQEKFGREISGSQYKNYYVIRRLDFAYNKSATKLYPEGYIALLKELDFAAVPNSIFTCFRVDKEQVYPQFLDYLFHDNFHGKWLRKFIEVGARAHGSLSIDNDFLFRMPVLLPSPKEQQKIADCLSSLDELINAENQKLEALQQHKKGLLQQLFPAEGEKIPKVRFREFKDCGEWVEKTLGSCLIRQPDYGINASAVPYSTVLPTYLRITDISETGHFLKKDKVSVEKNVTEENYLEAGDIVLARTGASVGKSYKYISEDGRLVFAGYLIRVKPDQTKLKSKLLIQLLSTDSYWRWVRLTSARSGQPGINGTEYASMILSLPPTTKEQGVISDCLSSLDDIITAQSQKIESLKAHKKGLMQQLFPNMN